MFQIKNTITVLVFSFILVLFVTITSSFAGEIIVTNDGKRISGEIVGFENGQYHIQIGRFVKRVSESDIRQIIDSSTQSSTNANHPPEVVVPSTSHVSHPVSSTSESIYHANYAPEPENRLESTDSPESVLNKLTAGNPALSKYLEMQKSNGVSGDAMMNQVKQMQANPMMLQMMSRFKDPAFQKNFLANIEKMKGAMNPGQDGISGDGKPDPNVELLKGLFKQLNEAKPGQ